MVKLIDIIRAMVLLIVMIISTILIFSYFKWDNPDKGLWTISAAFSIFPTMLIGFKLFLK